MHSHWADKCYRLWSSDRKLLEVSFKRSGPGVYVSLPSDMDDERSGIFYLGLWLINLYIHFHWYRTYPDHYQAEGPRFGFSFFDDLLFIYHGNSTGYSNDNSSTAMYMPWHWKHCTHEVWDSYHGWIKPKGYLPNPEDTRVVTKHDYTYTLNSGEIQHRKAAICKERRIWRRIFQCQSQRLGEVRSVH